MEENQNPFQNFILERTQEDKKAEMAEFLKTAFAPPPGAGPGGPGPGGPGPGGPGGPGPGGPGGGMQRNMEIIMSMMTTEGAEELRKMMSNPFGDSGDYDASLEDKNWLQQPNKLKWKENTPQVSADEMREAFACSKCGDEMQCECWNTGCQFYGNCRKCIVFHLALKQFPTCQRSSTLAAKGLEDHYIIFSQDQNK